LPPGETPTRASVGGLGLVHSRGFALVNDRYIGKTKDDTMVSTTTVKISKKTSRELEALQARFLRRSGKRITKQAIIEDLVNRAIDDPEPLIILQPPRAPPPPKIRAMIRKYPSDWGMKTREEEIDELLYGADD
jgi:hypothetical protein